MGEWRSLPQTISREWFWSGVSASLLESVSTRLPGVLQGFSLSSRSLKNTLFPENK